MEKKKILFATFSLALSATAIANSHALSVARAEFLQEDSRLNVIWSQLLDRNDRAFLRQSQKQWLKNKDVVCGKISANVSERKLITIYNCHRDMTFARSHELLKFSSY